jgi:hypothetical protein
MISTASIQVVNHLSSIKDHVALAGLILQLLNSVIDSAKIEQMLETQQMPLFNIHQTHLSCVKLMEPDLTDAPEVV